MALKIPKRLKLHPSIQRSKYQERELAKRVGGQVTVGSGNKDVKGDVRKKRVMRIEAKTTGNKSFSVTREIIRKIEEAALASDELPALVVEFIDGKGKVQSSVAVVPLYVLEMITDFQEEQQ